MVSPELITKALATIGSSPANREYFFANLHSSDWLEPLRAAGQFKFPIRAVRDERGIQFLSWPESAYLAQVAAEKPELVRDIILESQETDNERVHQGFIEAAIRMTPPPAADVARFEASWIRKQPFLYTLYPEKAGALISHLSANGETQAALHLARELLVIVPPPAQSPGEEENEFSPRREPKGKCRQWEYQQVLATHVPDMVKAAPESAIRLLLDLLEAALRVCSHGQEDETEDYSWIWRPDVEVTRFEDFREALVSAAREAALLMSTSAELTVRAVDLLSSRNWRIFRRLAAHTLRKAPQTPIGKIEELLTQPIEYEEFPRHCPEFGKLLGERFADLSDRGKGTILALIEKGPDLSIFKKRKEAEGSPASQEEINEISDQWRLSWLHQIRTTLDPTWKERYSGFVSRFGAPSGDDGMGGIHSWVGPTSPKSSEDLREMSGDELIDFLKTWHATGLWNAPSEEGLGRSLSAMLATEPQKLATSAMLLRGFDPTYVRSAIDGFTAAAKGGQSFDYPPVLELCQWVVGQGNEVKALKHTMERDPDWNWTRKSIAWLLNQMLQAEGSAAVPLAERQRIWTILEHLASDPVPPEQNRKYNKGIFAGSSSLNVTRGVALDAMLSYARWLHKQGAIGEEGKLNSIHELKTVFDDHIVNDDSVVAREVLGRGFATLFWLDRDWATSRVADVFGKDDRGDIAFANYLLFCPPYHHLLPILVPYYRRAIEQIAKGYRKEVDEIDRHLAQHLMGLYWHGKVAIESADLLLDQFFGTAPAKLRSLAIEFIGRSLHGAAPVDPDVLKRLTDVWEWRWAELRKYRCDGEPVPFGIWFASGQFDVDWSFDNLLSVLRLCHKAELDFWVVERLATVAQYRPAAAVEALGMMIEGDREGWAMHGWHDHPRTVLVTALSSSDQRARAEAERVIHLMGSRGWYGYRDLLR
jgi:hypothetical protein